MLLQLFNQISLICDWFFNVDCQQSAKYVDYSNSRLNGDNVPFLDDQMARGEVVTAQPAVTEEPTTTT